MFFENFKLERIAVRDGELRLRHGGSGPPLLLVHGNPQTHAMWHKVAPVLARTYTVICPDLRGYGGSMKPPATADHEPYSKVNMARDLVELMEQLGHKSFRVASHDRGSRVAHRLALDHPERVEKLAVMDIVPTIEHFERADMQFGLGYYHWFWFAQPHPFPENIISASPEAWFKAHTSREPKQDGFFDPDALADYLTHVRMPEMIRGMCEDYRAAASIDFQHDRASRAAGHKVRCPLLAMWGRKGKIEQWHDAVAIWRQYCAGFVSGGAVNSGHYLAEEAPDEVLAQLMPFLAGK
jgi:haloacetate dehalogenase